MKSRVRPVLHSILGAIEGIEATIGDSTLEEYSENWGVRHAVERGVEIISEASRRLPQRLLDQQPSIEWRQVHGIGNVLRHDYDEIIDEVI